MERLFFRVLNMSLSAAVVIAVVVLARLLLRSAPKKWRYLLWSAAGFRLCCPVSFQAFFSLFRLKHLIMNSVGGAKNAAILPQGMPSAMQLAVPASSAAPAAAPLAPTAVPAVIPATAAPVSEPVRLWPHLGVVLWLGGIAVMLILGIIRYFRMKHVLADAAALEKGVFATDRISVPFILGILPSRIYLPAGLDGEEQGFVLAHERVHIRRGDHWVKLLAYILLAIHWFNPAVWAAFFLMSRDMEMSCDERVLRELGGSAKAYSRTLLRFAEGIQFPAPAPLGFGESDAKSRIQNALRWKRPKLWITIMAIVLSIAVVCACTADPKEPKETDMQATGGDTVRFSREDETICLQGTKGNRSFGEILEELALTGYTSHEEDHTLDHLLSGQASLTIGMDKDSVLLALYDSQPYGARFRADTEPGILLGDEEDGYDCLTGVFAGVPFSMTLRYHEGYTDLLRFVALQLWPVVDGEKVYSRVKEVLIHQLGEPDDVIYGEGAASWKTPNGFLGVNITTLGGGEPYILIELSGAVESDTPWSWTSTLKAPDFREAALTSGSEEVLLTKAQAAKLMELLNAVPREQVVGGRGIPSEQVLELRDTGYALRFAGGVIELDCEKQVALSAPAAPVWEIHDEVLYAWLDALWEGSPFGQTDNPLGLTLRAEDVTPTGCTLVFTQSGGAVTGELQTGLDFILFQRDADGKWIELPANEETVWYSLAYGIRNSGTTELKAEWEWLYGALKDGHYRIRKEIIDYHAPGEFDTYAIDAEFDISGGAGETLLGNTSADIVNSMGAGRIDIRSDEYGTAAKGKIEIYAKDQGTLDVRILADLQIGPEDWGGIAFYLPAGCRLESVSCTYPETDGAAAEDPQVNVWTTAADNVKYTTMIEIGRDRSRNISGGGTGTVVIEASCPWDSSDPLRSLTFGVDCGAEERDGYVSMGVEHREILVVIRSP